MFQPNSSTKPNKPTAPASPKTVRTGLQLVAASRSYAKLRELRGKVRFSVSHAELKQDR